MNIGFRLYNYLSERFITEYNMKVLVISLSLSGEVFSTENTRRPTGIFCYIYKCMKKVWPGNKIYDRCQ